MQDTVSLEGEAKRRRTMRPVRGMLTAGVVIAAGLFASFAMATPGSDLTRASKKASALVHRVHDGAKGCHGWCTPTWGPCRQYSHKHDKSCNVVTCKGKPLNPGSDHCKWY